MITLVLYQKDYWLIYMYPEVFEELITIHPDYEIEIYKIVNGKLVEKTVRIIELNIG